MFFEMCNGLGDDIVRFKLNVLTLLLIVLMALAHK